MAPGDDGQFTPARRQEQLAFDFDADETPTLPAGRSSNPDFEAISIFDDPDMAEESRFPAQITENPTSTSNPERPRTLAAGYNKRSQVMTVVFRDGTWWNYYSVTSLTWKNFKSAYSKGWYLYASGLDRWATMGRADAGFLSGPERTELARAAAVAQRSAGGLQSGQSAAYAAKLRRQDTRIKGKGTLTPARDRISNPYVERQRKRRGL